MKLPFRSARVTLLVPASPTIEKVLVTVRELVARSYLTGLATKFRES